MTYSSVAVQKYPRLVRLKITFSYEFNKKNLQVASRMLSMNKTAVINYLITQ